MRERRTAAEWEAWASQSRWFEWPDGFKPIITDLAATEAERDRFAEVLATLRTRYAECVERAERDEAEVKALREELAAMALDNARLRDLLERYVKADPSDVRGAPETQLYKDAAAAITFTPDELAQEVRWLLETGTSGEHETVDPDEWERRKDALLAKLGGGA